MNDLNLLYEITETLGSLGPLPRTLQRVLQIMAQSMNMRRGTVTILNPETSELQIEVAHGLTAEARRRGRYKLGEGITGRVVETGEPAVVPRVSQEPLFLNRTRSRGSREKEELSFLCVPIKINYKTIGALSVDKLHRDLDLDRDLRQLTIIASIIAQTVNNLLLIDREKERLQNENLTLKGQLQERYQVGNIIGTSGRMREVFEMIQRVAKSNATILIRGESGTGKEMVASALHYNSLRADKPFIKVNLAALPETLVESELFGHERGAFTGAMQRKQGRFELAQGGTIFLDEIGDLSLNVQLKLLRVIQEREYTRLGGTTTLKADIRLLAATHRDLEQALSTGIFREDLYYRLNVFPIYLPPLAGAHGRHPGPVGTLLNQVRRGARQAGEAAVGPGPGPAHAVPLARQRPGTGEHHRAGGAGVRRRHHPQRPPASHLAAAGAGGGPPGPVGPGGAPGAGTHHRGPAPDPGQPEPGGPNPGHQPEDSGLQDQAVRHRSPALPGGVIRV